MVLCCQCFNCDCFSVSRFVCYQICLYHKVREWKASMLISDEILLAKVKQLLIENVGDDSPATVKR